MKRLCDLGLSNKENKALARDFDTLLEKFQRKLYPTGNYDVALVTFLARWLEERVNRDWRQENKESSQAITESLLAPLRETLSKMPLWDNASVSPLKKRLFLAGKLDLLCLQAFVKIHWIQSGSPRASVLKKDGTPSKETQENFGICYGEITGENTKLCRSIHDFLKENTIAKEDWDLLALLRPLNLAMPFETDKESVVALTRVLDYCEQSLTEHFIHTEKTDYNEIFLGCFRALKGFHPSDYMIAIATEGIEHLLIDECQDTSKAQFTLLEALCQNFTKEHHTLCFVGDPLQSIYRFRGADVGAFLRVWQEGAFAGLPLERLELSSNFRTRPALLETINQTFEMLLPGRDMVFSTQSCYRTVVAAKPEGESGLSCRIFKDAHAEAEFIAEQIQAILERSENESIGILVRRRRDIQKLLYALESDIFK